MTNSPPQAIRDLARELLKAESQRAQGAEGPAGAGDRVCQRLQEHLSTLIGNIGFSALLGRALSKARSEFPFLGTVKPGETSAVCLEGLHESAEGGDPAEIGAGLAALLANTLWLFVSLVGEDLGWRIIRAIWPNLPLEEQSSNVEG